MFEHDYLRQAQSLELALADADHWHKHFSFAVDNPWKFFVLVWRVRLEFFWAAVRDRDLPGKELTENEWQSNPSTEALVRQDLFECAQFVKKHWWQQ